MPTFRVIVSRHVRQLAEIDLEAEHTDSVMNAVRELAHDVDLDWTSDTPDPTLAIVVESVTRLPD